MRDRLWKGKRIDNGEWVIGNLIYSEDAEEGWETIIIPTFDSNMFTKGGAKGNLGFENWYRVDKDTLCQYTGLNDNTKWESLTEEEKQRFYNQVCSEDGKTIKYPHIEDVKHLWKGKMIWENDVIKTNCGNVRVIYSAEPSPYENSFNVGFEVLFYNITDNENYRRDVGFWACYRGFGVIGNVFDNPELLGV